MINQIIEAYLGSRRSWCVVICLPLPSLVGLIVGCFPLSFIYAAGGMGAKMPASWERKASGQASAKAAETSGQTLHQSFK